MDDIILYVINATAYAIDPGAAAVGVGTVAIPLGPAPLAAGGHDLGLLLSDGNGDLNIAYTPSIADPVVDFGIQVTLDAGANFHVVTDSSRPNVAGIDHVWAPLVLHGQPVYAVVVRMG